MLPPSPPASRAAPNRSSRRRTGSRRLVSRLRMVAEVEGSRRAERSRREVGPPGAEAGVRRAAGEGAEPVPRRAAASYPSNGVRWIPRSTPGWTSAASLRAPGQLRPKRQQGRPALRHGWAPGRRCRTIRCRAQSRRYRLSRRCLTTRRRQPMVPSRWYAPLRWPRAVPKVTPRRSEGWWRPHWRSRRWPLWCARPSSWRPCSWRPRPWRPRPWQPRSCGRAAGARSAGRGRGTALLCGGRWGSRLFAFTLLHAVRTRVGAGGHAGVADKQRARGAEPIVRAGGRRTAAPVAVHCRYAIPSWGRWLCAWPRTSWRVVPRERGIMRIPHRSGRARSPPHSSRR